jgi:hypothetical protein
MKKIIILVSIISVALSSCTSTKSITYNDDIYVDPAQDRLEKARLAAEKKKKQEEEARKQEEERAAELAAQKAKDDANPAYKDPVYDKDDYYDYQYASRIRRFNQPVCGVGYYDNYYTNYYWYNGNPAMYGTSIYSSYNYWGGGYGGGWPSSYFGVSYGWGYPNYGYNNYNPYCGWGNGYSNAYWQGYYNGYNNGFYNGYYGYPYGGYNNPYYNGWGYYNQFDVNSGYNKPTNAPRGSHDGGNNGRNSNPGLASNGLAQKYIQEVQVAQAMTPKFNSELRSTNPVKSHSGFTTINDNSLNMNSGGVKPLGNSGNSNPRNNGSINTSGNNDVNYNNGTIGNSGNTNPKNPGGMISGGDTQFNNGNTPKTNTPKHNGGITPINTEPVKPVKTYNNNDNFNSPKTPRAYENIKPSMNTGGGNNNSSPSNNGPRNSNSGGGHRPR